MIDLDEVRKELERRTKLPRRHAGSFNWHNKEVKEAGIVDTFLADSVPRAQHPYLTFETVEDDPPDARVFTNDRSPVGLELVELVSADAIAAQIRADRAPEGERHRHDVQRHAAMSQWSESKYFWEQVREGISTKERKCDHLFEGGQPLALLFHSDETWLYDYIESHLESDSVGPTRFREIWLLLGYHPKKNGYPLYRLAPSCASKAAEHTVSG